MSANDRIQQFKDGIITLNELKTLLKEHGLIIVNRKDGTGRADIFPIN